SVASPRCGRGPGSSSTTRWFTPCGRPRTSTMPDTPESIDLGAIPSNEGFFLLRDHPEKPFPPSPTANTAWRFCSTFRDSVPSLRDAVLDLIRNTQRKIFITSFILGDDELIEALAAAARRLTGGVYVISGLNEQSLRKGLAELAELADRSEK